MQKLGLLLVLASLSLLAACGSSSSSSSGSVTSINVSCSPGVVASGQTSQCSASVNGTGNFSSSVTWSATAGSISSSGLLTAPVVTTSLVDTVAATSTQNSQISGTATVTVNATASGANVQPIIVDEGPDPANFISTNIPFTTVTVCVPGTTTCQTIDHVLVDTGSPGLRLISGVLSISLPNANDGSGNPLDECLVFGDGYVWGPVATADIYIGGSSNNGEKASSTPVQIMIPASSSPAVPTSCSDQNPNGGYGNEGGSIDAFGAKGIIGVGLFQQDCGPACTTENSSAPAVYYDCPASGCTGPTFVPLANQVTNPVVLFSSDNNGVLLQLQSVADGGAPTASGSLIFGIGTESNNTLGSANVYVVPDSGKNQGDFITTYQGHAYPQSFIDSGSNGYLFLDSSTTGIPQCTNSYDSDWYCPSTSPDTLSASNQGQSASGAVGSPVPVSFTIENTDTLFNTDNTAFSTLAGPNPGAFDWGLSFFYGKSIFTAIDNVSTPQGTGPYFAY